MDPARLSIQNGIELTQPCTVTLDIPRLLQPEELTAIENRIKMGFQDQMDKRVDERVAKELKPLQQEVAVLKKALADLKKAGKVNYCEIIKGS